MARALEMSMRLLVLSRYSRLGASSRLRTLQYRGWLEDAGFEVEYSALFDDAYLRGLYAGNQSKAAIPSYYRQRISRLWHKPPPTLIWVEYEALPWVPWMVENTLLPKSVPVVSDYDDAVFHRYDQNRHAPVRWLLGRKIDRIMQRSALVMAGNEYLADRARLSGATGVEVVPTVVDLTAYTPRVKSTVDADVVVGWIGTPETWSAFALDQYERLKGSLSEQGARFRAVGAELKAGKMGSLEVIPWREDTEVLAIQGMDIGVMPLPDTPWARGKCGYKLIQYMACGLPVIASPVGVNTEIVEHGVNGFLATTDAEWREALVMLLRDPDLRSRMGAAGRRKVEKQYSLQVWGPRVAGMLSKVAKEHIA